MSRSPSPPQQWTEDDVEKLILDPRTVGVGAFPGIIDEPTWLKANVMQIKNKGADRYLTRLLVVLRDVYEGYGPIGSPFTKDDAPEKIIMDPRAVGVGSFEPAITDDVWIEANVKQIERMGAQRFLTTMLDVLRHDFGSAGSAEEQKQPATSQPPRQRPTARKGYHPRDTLGLYSHIIPTLVQMKKRGDNLAEDKIDDLSNAIVFDCRGLPIEFVADTGDATFDEMQATRDPVRLPFETCYFEFGQEIAIFAETFNQSMGLPTALDPEQGDRHVGTTVEFEVFKDWSSPSFVPELAQTSAGEFYNDFTVDSYNEWAAHFSGDDYEPVAEIPFFEEVNDPTGMQAAARLLLGVLTLLQDDLVINSQHRPDPRPWLTDHRRARGQPPKSGDARVLTLNVPAIRNQAKRTPIGTHESPALHWRRGHLRTLHRGTEAEARTWIRKCLVGDPERGYIVKNYRLTTTMASLIRPAGSAESSNE